MSKFNPGFTLIEVLIVMVIASIIATAGTAISLDSYRLERFHSDVKLINALLIETRSAAQTNKTASDHGLHIERGAATIFSGDVYNESNKENQSFPISLSSEEGAIDIIFQAFSGTLSLPRAFNLTDGRRNKTFHINKQGFLE